MARILCLDYGRQRIGIAVSDSLGLTAQPVETLTGLNREELLKRVCALVEQMEVRKIILGLPLTLKGEKGNMAMEVEKFADKLYQKTGIPVILWDERFTSVQAQRIIHQKGGKPSRKKEDIDLISAVLLLQNYLDFLRESSVNNHEEKM